MARQPLRITRGSAAQVAAYAGPFGEPVANTETRRLHIQDGATPGGVPQARLDEIFGTPNVSTLRTYPTSLLFPGAVVTTSGYTISSDGGGGGFQWDASATAADDGCLIIKPTAVSGAGRWRRLLNGGPLTPAMCGAIGSGDETAVFERLFSRGVPVLIPRGTGYIINSNMTAPDGVRITLDGTLTGLGVVTFAGSATITGTGSLGLGPSNPLSYLTLKLQAGTIRLSGFKVRPTGPNNPIIVSPIAAGIDLLVIEGLDISGAQFGILRDFLAPGAVIAAYIIKNTITNGTGDGVEWNVGPNDRRLKIDQNIIDLMDGMVPNGGLVLLLQEILLHLMGIMKNFAQYQREFTINDNIISRVRQGIHVEYAYGFLILDNKFDEIRSSYSISSGIEVAAIAVYGSAGFKIADNLVTRSDANWLIAMRVVAGVYRGSSRDYVVEDNTAIDAGFGLALTQSSNPLNPMYAVFRGNVFLRSPFSIKGGGHITIDSNTFQGGWGQTAFAYRYQASELSSGFMPTQRGLVRITNNNASDPIGRPSASIMATETAADTTNTIVEAHGNNFEVASGVDQIIPGQRTFTAAQGTFPYGREFLRGDIVIDTSAGPGTAAKVWTVTASGSRNKDADLYAIFDAAGGVIRTANYAWTDPGNHTVGQAVTLTDATSVVKRGIVSRVYISGGQYRMDLIDGATGAPLNLGTLGSGTITSTNLVAYAG